MITIVKAKEEDLNTLYEIIDETKRYFRENNIPQWFNNYPNEIIPDDLKEDNLFVIKDDEKIIGLYTKKDYEETYEEIDGEWLDESPYVVIHRMAIRNEYKGKGIAKIVFDYIKKNHSHIRVDTHELNNSMNRCLIKNDFKYCGIIKLKDNSLRNAYEFIG